MVRKSTKSHTPRATGWTVFERRGHYVTKADGEFIPTGYGNPRPATDAEVTHEVARRLENAELARRRSAFMERPDYQVAHAIRNAIEVMDEDNHPLDRLTPEEWNEFRNKICGTDREGQ